MRILVTGATGFVGSQLVPSLVSRGDAIRALVRKTSRLEDLRHPRVELCYGDVTDPDSLRNAVQGIEAVIHCASVVGESGNREEFLRVNVEGTRNLLEACRGLPLKRFVHISSLSVITGYKDHEGTKEEAPYRPTGENYADTKIEAEKLVLEYGRRHQIPVTILRPGFIFGPGDRLFLPTVIKNLREGKVKLIDQGKKLLNLTHVGNLIEAIDRALTQDEAVGEIFNITDGEKVSKRQFFFAVADLMGIPRPAKSIPFPVAWILCAVVTALYKILRIRKLPPISRMKLRFAGQNQWFDISKSERLLGYRHKIRFEEGLKDAVRWYRETLEPG
jgi:nucleoside-diphosphate-sugar epimerase